MIAKKAKPENAASEPTSKELKAKSEKLEEEQQASAAKTATYESEKAELISRAYIQDDADARRRLDELNAALGDEQRKREDIETALAPLREQEATAIAREQAAAKAAELERLEARVPKALEAAERTAEAILERARELRPLIADHETALATFSRVRKRLAELSGNESVAADLGELEPARIAVRVVEQAGLSGVVPASDVWIEQQRAELREGAAYARGKGDGRREAGAEHQAPSTGPASESGAARQRREIYGE